MLGNARECRAFSLAVGVTLPSWTIHPRPRYPLPAGLSISGRDIRPGSLRCEHGFAVNVPNAPPNSTLGAFPAIIVAYAPSVWGASRSLGR